MLLTSPTGTLEAGLTMRSRMLRLFVSGVLLTLTLACPHASLQTDTGFSGPADALARVRASGKLRAVSRVNPATFVVDRYGPAGIEYELARDFAASLGVELEMIPAANGVRALKFIDPAAGQAERYYRVITPLE